MKTKILTSILLGVLVTCFVSPGMATAANGNGAGLERVPVFIGFRQTPGPSEQALVRAQGGAIKYSYTLVPAIAASIPEPAIEGLRRNPNVTIVEPDIEVYAVDDELVNSWGVEHIGAGIVHDGSNLGTGVKVAIIDSGVDYTHPDLNANFDLGNLGKDFVNNDDDPMDDAGHGTHVAGTVAAEYNDVGVVGVAPEASLYAYKVLNASGSGDYSDIIAAMQKCVADGIQVANLSLGSSGDPGETVEAAFEAAATAGIVIVAAAGNSGNRPGIGDNVIYPARYESCIAVAATDQSDSRARWSSTGPDVEISAPGVGINSTLLGGGYGYKSGTSMASPHVAGVVALMIKAGVAEVRDTLATTADDLGNPLWYGYGLVDADEAAAGSVEPPVLTTILVSPSNVILNIGDNQQFTASGKDQYGDPIDTGTIDWTSGNAAVGTINASGIFTATGEGDTTVTAIGDEGVSGGATVTVQAVPVEQPMYVGLIEMDYIVKEAGNNIFIRAVAVVKIMDAEGPVVGATVYGSWSDATSDIDSGVTDLQGLVELTSDAVKNPAIGTTFTFTVDDVVKSGWDYEKVYPSASITVP